MSSIRNSRSASMSKSLMSSATGAPLSESSACSSVLTVSTSLPRTTQLAASAHSLLSPRDSTAGAQTIAARNCFVAMSSGGSSESTDAISV